MRVTIQSLVLSLAALLLASCGGGGGSGNNTAFEPAGLVVTVSSASSSTTPSSLVGLTVQVRNPNGAAVSEGTEVRLRVSPPGVGLVSAAGAAPPDAIPIGEQVSSTTSGGIATFRFHSRSLGTATLTASVTDTAGGGRTVTGSTAITVSEGAPNDPRLSVQFGPTTLPSVPQGIPFSDVLFFGSPYISQVTVTIRNLDGTLRNGTTVATPNSCTTGTGVNAAIGTNLDATGIWLANGTTLCRSVTVGVNSGIGILYIASDNTPGTSTLTISTTDQQTGEVISVTRTYTFSNGTPRLPGSLLITADSSPVYVQGTNGAQSKSFEVSVFDGAGAFSPDPAAGINNLQVEIVGGAQGGERLIGVGATGGSAQGGTIAIRTLQGLGAFSYQSGSREGIVTLRATADRADNNVDNGIADPISSTRGFAVSDGKLFDLVITQPIPGTSLLSSPAILVDQVGAYFSPVTVVATDRLGNPVSPGTEIRFGLIDFPKVQGTSDFALRGNDGDPLEGNTTFTAPTGQFTTAGGGAGPGDTLVLFGKDVTGNRDLEGARTVQSVNSATSLSVTYRFNPNDDTGAAVNNGTVIPYIIGRATRSNITNSSQTDAFGTAQATLTYPSSAVGESAVLWAQGSGRVVNGVAKLVGDVQIIQLPGEGPVEVTASPGEVPANGTYPVEVCVLDLNGVGIEQASVSFLFQNLVGTGSVNGVSTTGTLPQKTGANGCLTAQITTNGVVAGNQDPVVVFSALGGQATVTVVSNGLILQAFPTKFVVSDGLYNVRLTLIDFNGAPVNDALIIVNCEATGNGTLNPVAGPGRTGEPQAIAECNGVSGVNCPGQTYATIAALGFGCVGAPPTGTCVFSTTNGSAEAEVDFKGIDLTDLAGTSPPPPSCN